MLSSRAFWIAALVLGLPLAGYGADPQEAASTGDRVGMGIAAGPVIEVATPGGRERERGVIIAPGIGIHVTSWFEYVIEGHLLHSVGPVGGTSAGVQPIGWRLHTTGRTHPFVSMGAGVAWVWLDGLAGIDRRRNYVTHLGGGVRRVTAGGAAWWVEARLSHLSNLSTAGGNLGVEHVTIAVGIGR